MNAIVAVNADWGIGYEDQLLVHIKPDLQRFRALTLGNTVIVGRKTLKTFPGGRPLKGRTTILLTRGAYPVQEDVAVCSDLPSVLEKIKGQDPETIFVIGGESVYRALLPHCKKVYVTKFQSETKADCFFPDLDALPEWTATEIGPMEVYEGIPYQYITYERQG